MMGDEVQRMLVVFDARFDAMERKLNNVIRANYAAASRVERAWRDVRVGISDAAVSAATSRLGAFGDVAASIGPAGAAAAVGIGAIATALRGAMVVAEWAEELQSAAGALNLSTTQLQEFRAAATLAGVPVQDMNDTLRQLQEILGRAQAGGRSGRQAGSLFAAIAIKPEELASIHTLDQLLPRVADGLRDLNKVAPAEAASIGARLGISPQVLAQLVQGRDRLSSLTAEARRYGMVVDESLIRQSAEAADKMRVASQVIDTQLRVALANLTPALTGAANGFANATNELNRFVQECRDALVPIQNVIEAIGRAIARMPGMQPFLDFAGRYPGFVHTDAGRRLFGNQETGLEMLARQGRFDRLQSGVNGMLTGGLTPEEIAAWRAANGWDPARGSAPPVLNGGDAGGRNPRRSSGRQPRPTAEPGYMVEVPGGFQWFSMRMVGSGENRRPEGLTGPVLVEYGDQIGRTRSDFVSAEQIDVRDPMNGFGVAKNGSVYDTGPLGDILTPENLSEQFQRYSDEMRDQTRDAIRGGLEAAVQGGWPGLAQYMAETLRNRMLDRLADVIEQMFNAASGGGGGNVFSSIFSIFSGGKVGKYATGTSFAPGGLAFVHKNELVELPMGSKVHPAGAARGLTSGASPTVMQFDLRGAVVTEDLLSQMNRMASRTATQAGVMALHAARKVVPAEMAQRARRRFG